VNAVNAVNGTPPVGHPFLATVLAVVGITMAVAGMVLEYLGESGYRRLRPGPGMVVAGIGAVACFVALAVAP